MKERIPQEPPLIEKLPAGPRPVWSVMIPAYNCAEFITRAIEGVLMQDPGAEHMQIEVVDDASTDGDLESIVREIGKGRVGYFRQSENQGSLRNFETCLQRSKGYYIHLLHGDDIVLEGYYEEMEKLFGKFPEIGSAFCMNSYINGAGVETGRTGKLLESAGIIPDWLEKISTIVYCQPPAVSVKREVYERLGSFYAGFFGEDWEMWCRIAAHYPVAYSPNCLAQYRTHLNNISTRFNQTGQSLDDIEMFLGIIQRNLPESKRKQLRDVAIKNFSANFAGVVSRSFNGDPKKFLGMVLRFGLKKPSKMRTYFLIRLVINYLVHVKNKL